MKLALFTLVTLQASFELGQGISIKRECSIDFEPMVFAQTDLEASVEAERGALLVKLTRDGPLITEKHSDGRSSTLVSPLSEMAPEIRTENYTTSDYSDESALYYKRMA